MKLAIGIPRRWLAGCLLVCAGLLLSGLPFVRAEEPDGKKTESKTDAKVEQGWKPLFDGKTLEGWKDSGFGSGGETAVENGSLMISFGEGCNGVTYQKEFPKVNYEVRLQAKRVEGTDFFCGMTFPVQDSPCSLILGGWGGAVVGLSSVDDQLAVENQTTLYRNFKNGQWYDVRLRVTKTRITAWLDDKPIVDQATTGHKFSIHPAVTKSKPFGLCAFSTSAALRKIELRALTEEEVKPAKPLVIEKD